MSRQITRACVSL